MPTVTVSIETFIQDQRITMTIERVDSNPNMDDSQDMDHWKIKLRRPGHKLTTYFSMGYGHKGKEPKAEDVLNCLASDASSVQNAGFEEWCGDMGYELDSRRSERTYKAVEHGTKRLLAFLGEEAFETLLWVTERE